MKTTAIIPARGGSKGIAGKNTRIVAGKPLIGWTIEAARSAKLVNQVLVSTDDDLIAKVALEFGARVVMRPPELSGDTASSESALLHALDWLEKEDSELPDVIAFLQCTSPLTISDDVDGTLCSLFSNEADTALAVCDFHYFIWECGNNGEFQGINHDKSIRLLRQERKPQYRETGAVYAMRTDGFLLNKHRFFGKTSFYVIPSKRVLEIDEPQDLDLARLMLESQAQKTLISSFPDSIKLIVFDFDGVMTDDTVQVDTNGIETVRCSRADGYGIEMARRAGLEMLIITKERNSVACQRAKKLKIPIFYGIDDKESALENYLAKIGVDWPNIVYVGNDINDLACIKRAGCGVAVANACSEVIESAKVKLSRSGGNHAVRELLDLILAQR